MDTLTLDIPHSPRPLSARSCRSIQRVNSCVSSASLKDARTDMRSDSRLSFTSQLDATSAHNSRVSSASQRDNARVKKNVLFTKNQMPSTTSRSENFATSQSDARRKSTPTLKVDSTKPNPLRHSNSFYESRPTSQITLRSFSDNNGENASNKKSYTKASQRRKSTAGKALKQTSTLGNYDSEDCFSNASDTLSESLPQSLCTDNIPPPNSPKMCWEQFEAHLKNIDDFSSNFVSVRPKTTFKSSSAFQSVMKDLYGNSEYGKPPDVIKAKTAASKFLGRKKSVSRIRSVGPGESDLVSNKNTPVERTPSRETVENAKRGWKILRQHTQELMAGKRMNKSNLTWNMLRHTMKGVSNMERARYDLYRRYGVIPTVQDDGTIVQENTMLSERARSAGTVRTSFNFNRSRFSSSASGFGRRTPKPKHTINSFFSQSWTPRCATAEN